MASITSPSWLKYVLPIAVFLLFTLAETGAGKNNYAAIYVVKTCVVTAALYVCRASLRDVQFSWKVLPSAVLAGLVVFAQWVFLNKYVNYYPLGDRAGFNPFGEVADPVLRTVYLFVRFYGLVLLIPVVEELFWRSFLLRYFTDPKIERVPQGAFTWTAFTIVAAGFALSHPEWLPALVTACAYALLLKKTKSIFACVVAHAVTNLALGVYILLTGEWHLW